MSNPVGRPSLYKPEYCEMLLDHMRQGLSFEAFAGALEVSRETLYEWQRVHPEFSDTVKRGKDLSLLCWEKAGMGIMMGKVFNANSAVFIFNMKNRFGWRDQPQEPVDEKNKPLLISMNYERKKKKIDAE